MCRAASGAAARAFQGVRLPADTPTADLLALAISGVPLVTEGVLDVAPALALDAGVPCNQSSVASNTMPMM